MNVKYPTFHDTFARFVNRVLASPAAAESTPNSALVPPCISLLLLLLALPRFDRVPSPPSTTPFSCHTTPSRRALPSCAATGWCAVAKYSRSWPRHRATWPLSLIGLKITLLV